MGRIKDKKGNTVNILGLVVDMNESQITCEEHIQDTKELYIDTPDGAVSISVDEFDMDSVIWYE